MITAFDFPLYWGLIFFLSSVFFPLSTIPFTSFPPSPSVFPLPFPLYSLFFSQSFWFCFLCFPFPLFSIFSFFSFLFFPYPFSPPPLLPIICHSINQQITLPVVSVAQPIKWYTTISSGHFLEWQSIQLQRRAVFPLPTKTR